MSPCSCQLLCSLPTRSPSIVDPCPFFKRSRSAEEGSKWWLLSSPPPISFSLGSRWANPRINSASLIFHGGCRCVHDFLAKLSLPLSSVSFGMVGMFRIPSAQHIKQILQADVSSQWKTRNGHHNGIDNVAFMAVRHCLISEWQVCFVLDCGVVHVVSLNTCDGNHKGYVCFLTKHIYLDLDAKSIILRSSSAIILGVLTNLIMHPSLKSRVG